MNREVFSPKGVAMWLIVNTKLSFKQIGEFCRLNLLEIQALANSNVGRLPLSPIDPIESGVLTEKNIKECEENEDLPLNCLIKTEESKKKKYTYVSLYRRKQKNEGIIWILKKNPEVDDEKLCKLLSTNLRNITNIRKKLKVDELDGEDPVKNGFCTKIALDELMR